MEKIEMHDKVQIIATGEVGFVVWFDEDHPEKNSFLIEIMGKCEMPEFYKREDFVKIPEE